MLERTPVGQLLTVQEVADLLRVSKGAVYKLVRNGQLELVKVLPLRSRITGRSYDQFLQSIADKQESQS